MSCNQPDKRKLEAGSRESSDRKQTKKAKKGLHPKIELECSVSNDIFNARSMRKMRHLYGRFDTLTFADHQDTSFDIEYSLSSIEQYAVTKLSSLPESTKATILPVVQNLKVEDGTWKKKTDIQWKLPVQRSIQYAFLDSFSNMLGRHCVMKLLQELVESDTSLDIINMGGSSRKDPFVRAIKVNFVVAESDFSGSSSASALESTDFQSAETHDIISPVPDVIVAKKEQVIFVVSVKRDKIRNDSVEQLTTQMLSHLSYDMDGHVGGLLISAHGARLYLAVKRGSTVTFVKLLQAFDFKSDLPVSFMDMLKHVNSLVKFLSHCATLSRQVTRK